MGEICAKACGREAIVPIGGGVGVGDRVAAFIAVTSEDLAACSERVGAVHLDGRTDPMACGDQAGIQRAILSVFEGVITNDIDGVFACVVKRDDATSGWQIGPSFGDIGFGEIRVIACALDIGQKAEHLSKAIGLVSDPDGLARSQARVGGEDDAAAFSCGLVGFFAFGSPPFSAFLALACSDTARFAFAGAALGVHIRDHPARYIDRLLCKIRDADRFFGFGSAF